HAAGAGPRPGGTDDGGGRLRAGGDPVRVPDRPAAVPGGDAAGGAAPGARARAGPAARPQSPGGPRPGIDLPEVPRQGPAASLRLGGGAGRRPGALPGRRTDQPPASLATQVRWWLWQNLRTAGRALGVGLTCGFLLGVLVWCFLSQDLAQM